MLEPTTLVTRTPSGLAELGARTTRLTPNGCWPAWGPGISAAATRTTPARASSPARRRRLRRARGRRGRGVRVLRSPGPVRRRAVDEEMPAIALRPTPSSADRHDNLIHGQATSCYQPVAAA